MPTPLPILYSFRRCPYAIRARLALASAELPHELREIQLRAKPAALLAASPKGTVPVLVLPSYGYNHGEPVQNAGADAVVDGFLALLAPETRPAPTLK